MALSARELTLILRVQSAGASNVRRLQADLMSLERSGQSLNQKFLNASRAVGAVGRQLQLAGGIGTFALGLAANQAAQLQSKVTLAATQVRNTVTGVQQQATKDFNGILGLMARFPQSADDMAAALYDVYSTLNVNGKQGIGILQQIDKAATAGGLSAQDAASGLLSIVSNFNKGNASIKVVRNEFNRMFAAVRYGRVTMQEFSNTLSTTAPAAKIAGQSLDNMAGTFAFLSRSLGPNKAAVGYARLVEVLSGTQMQDGLKKVGVNIDGANGKMLQLDKVIQILVHRFPYLAQGGIKALNFFKDIGNIQSTIQARRAFATLVKDVGGYRDILGKTTHDNTEFAKSYKALAQSAGVQWQVLINNLKAVGLQIGMAVLPAFVEMSKYVREVVDWFNKLSPSTKDVIGRIAAFTAVGALLGGTLLTIVAAAGAAAASVTALGDAFLLVAGGLTVYASLAALGKKIYDNWDSLGSLIKKVANDIKVVLQDLGAAITAFYHGHIDDAFSHLGDAIKAAIPAVKDALDLLMQSVIDWGKEFVTTTQGFITAAVAGMIFASKRRGGIASKAGGAFDAMDLLSLGIGAPVGPMGATLKAGLKAEDIAKAREQFLKNIGGTAGLKKALELNAFTGQFSGNQQRALEQYVAQTERDANRLAPRLARAFAPLVSPWAAYKQSATAAEDAQLRSYWEKQAAAADSLVMERRRVSQIQTMRAAGLPGFAAGQAAMTPATNAAVRDVQIAAQRATPELTAMERAGIAVGAMGTSLGSTLPVAAAGFKSLGAAAASAGKSLLTFIGMGNPFLGAVAALGVGAYIAGNAINKWVTGANVDLGKLDQTFKNAQDGITGFRGAIFSAADSMNAFDQSKKTLAGLTREMNNQQDALKKLTPGTQSYIKASKQLAAVTHQRAQANIQLQESQQAVNDSMTQANANAKRASIGIDQAAAFTSGNFGGTAIGSIGDLLKTVTDGYKTLQAAAQNLLPNISAVNAAISAGVNPRGMKESFAAISSTYAALLHQGKAFRDNLTQVQVAIGHAFNPAELVFFAKNITKDILPAVEAISNHIHALPSRAVIRFLSNHKEVQMGIAAIVDQFNRLPTKKELKLLTNNRQVDDWIAHFINRFHKLPTQKQINIHIKGVEEAQRQIEKVQKKTGELQSEAHQVGRLGGPGQLKVNTSAVDAARRKINQLNKDAQKSSTHHIKIAFNPTPDSVAKSYESLVGKMATIGTNAGTGWASAFSATAKATATAHVTLVVNAFKKSYAISSPSKVMKKQIGDPILQGILAPLKDKKSINDAADQAVSTMIDAFQSNRQTFSDQMGQLFAGPTFVGPNSFGTELQQKLGFGEKVSIQDLKGDLQAQLHQFQTFHRSLDRLNRRRGTSFAFIDAIRQLGPAAQSEVNALLHATPRQLRQYEKLWERSQKLINSRATKETKQTVAAWRKQGEAVALGFMSGMQAHSAQLSRFFKNLFLKLVNDVKHTHKSHSPSRVYMQEGVNVAMGFKMGVEKGMRGGIKLNPTLPVGRLHHRGPQVASVTNNYYYKNEYNITTQPQDNLLSVLRKHDRLTRVHP